MNPLSYYDETCLNFYRVVLRVVSGEVNFFEGIEWCIHHKSPGHFAHTSKADGLSRVGNGGAMAQAYRNEFLFEREEDALLFSLRFGGK